MISVGGVVIIGGSGTSGPALSDATPAALGTATAGVSTEASRADHVHASETVDGMTDPALWTAVNGNGTAQIAGGVASCVTPSGADTASPNRPSLYRSVSGSGRTLVDVAARLVTMSGTLGGAVNRALFNVANVADGANSSYATTADFGVSIVVFSDAAGVVGDWSGGVFNTRITSPGVFSLDGLDWVRIIVYPDRYVALRGRGATYAAAVWTPWFTQSVTWAYRAIDRVSVAGYRNGAQAEAHIVEWDDLVMVVR